MSRAICRLCRKVYTNKGNTTSFAAHLDHEHGDDARFNTGEKTTAGTAPVAQRQKLLDFKPPSLSIPHEKQTQIDESLLKLMVGKILPLSLCDNKHFRTFAGHMNLRYSLTVAIVESDELLLIPRIDSSRSWLYKVPSRKAIVAKLVEKRRLAEQRVMDELKHISDVAITHDGWTSLNTESFSTVTAHYITDDWELKTVVLETKKVEGSHTDQTPQESKVQGDHDLRWAQM